MSRHVLCRRPYPHTDPGTSDHLHPELENNRSSIHLYTVGLVIFASLDFREFVIFGTSQSLEHTNYFWFWCGNNIYTIWQ